MDTKYLASETTRAAAMDLGEAMRVRDSAARNYARFMSGDRSGSLAYCEAGMLLASFVAFDTRVKG